MNPTLAQQQKEVYLEGKIIEINQNSLIVQLNDGEKVTVIDETNRFKTGEQIEVYKTLDQNNKPIYYASDHARKLPIYILTVIFIVIAGLIGKGKGIRAVAAMFMSLICIILVIIPAIISGFNPILIAILGAGLILTVSVYFVHGINWTTSATLISTIIAAIAALALGVLFSNLAKLTGLGNEEAIYIQQLSSQINLSALLIAGMIIGSLGALVDSTIAQAAVIRELSALNPEMSWQKLYKSGMGVGFDHIGSLINTLVLAYAGSSLPLFVLFNLGGFNTGHVLNMELIASEIIQALVGSIGLILAVPISTLIAAWMFAGNKRPGGHHHHHHH